MASARDEPPFTNTLIVVCCHAIYIGGQGGPQNEQNWLIERFQSGETPTFIKHIEEGVRLVSQSHGKALLTFSGGATKTRKIRELKETGWFDPDVLDTRTEAESYEDVARELNHFNYLGKTHQNSIFQERFATDSYQNILLSLLQYPIWLDQQQRARDGLDDTDVTARPVARGGVQLCLPRRLIIVSHEFKRDRFLKLHVPAIMSLLEPLVGPSLMGVEYIGINPPFDEVKLKEIGEGDRLHGYGVWGGDLHGRGVLLSQKRIHRGWSKDGFLRNVGNWYSERTRLQIESILDGSIPPDV